MAHSDTVYRVSQNADWSETYVTVSQKLKLCSLMDRYDFVFVGPDKKLGKCDIIQPKTRVDPKHKPIRERYYPETSPVRYDFGYGGGGKVLFNGPHLHGLLRACFNSC